MKRIFNVQENNATIDVALLIARVSIAALMLVHGIPKLGMLMSGEAAQFPALFGMSAEISLAMAVFAEVLCSILLLAGFATRLAAVPLAITMLVAVLVVHGADPLAQKELALLYLIFYVMLILAGGGRYSLDYLLQQKLESRQTVAEVN